MRARWLVLCAALIVSAGCGDEDRPPDDAGSSPRDVGPRTDARPSDGSAGLDAVIVETPDAQPEDATTPDSSAADAIGQPDAIVGADAGPEDGPATDAIVEGDVGPTDGGAGDALAADAPIGDVFQGDAIPADALTGDALPGDALVSDAGAGDGGTGFDPNARATQIANAVCDFVARCEAIVLLANGQTIQDCRTDQHTGLVADLNAIAGAVNAGTTIFDSNRFDGCEAAFRFAGCERGPDPSACSPLFTGTRQQGEGCALSAECLSNLYCTAVPAQCGSCQPLAGAGQRCEAVPCAIGTVCLQVQQGVSMCVPNTADENASCGTVATGLCRGHLDCVGTGAAATCRRPAALNAVCDPQLRTASDCDFRGGTVCVAGTCTAASLSDPGESCVLPNVCTTAGVCSQQQCASLPGVGLPCFQGQCAANTYCDGTTCRALKQRDQQCAASSECVEPLVCSAASRTCQPPAWLPCPRVVPDAGVVDSGPRDGGGGPDADAGVSDSGALDAGSGDVGPRPDGGADPIDPPAHAQRMAEALCGFFDRCEPARLSFSEQDVAACTAANRAELEPLYAAAVNAVQAGRMGFSQAAFEACVTAMVQDECVLGVPDCAFLVGLQARGDPCFWGPECAEGSYCTASPFGSCGTCAPRAGLTELCTVIPCVEHAVCADVGGTRRCVRNDVAEGAPCGTLGTGICTGHLSCTGTGPGTARTCTLPAALNAACDPNGTSAPYCDLYNNGICVSAMCTTVVWNGAAGSCAPPAQCTTSARCSAAQVCEALPGASAPCRNGECAEGAYCDAMAVCRAQIASGGSCTESDQCQGALVCAPSGAGPACTDLYWSSCP